MNATQCRACCARAISLVLDFGLMPPSRRFLTAETACRPEPIHPLRLLRCEACGLLQLADAPGLTAPPTPLPEPTDAAEAFASRLVARFKLRPADVVLAIAEGNNYASDAFQNLNIHTLPLPSADALHQQEYGAARLILAHDALPAADNPHRVLRDLEHALADDGIAVLELPDLMQLHDDLCYDLVCHESRSYFTVAMLAELAAKHGLELVDVERSEDCPNWLRVLVQRRGGAAGVRPSVAVTIARERAAELHRPGPWSDFAVLAEQGRDMLNSELEEWQYRNRPIIAYSVGGRGMTMLSFCGAAPLRLPYFIDECESLHGTLTPGHRIPVVGPEKLRSERPEAVLLLGRSWNADGDGPLHDYWRGGGRILLPLPKPHYAEPRAAGAAGRQEALAGVSFSEFA